MVLVSFYGVGLLLWCWSPLIALVSYLSKCCLIEAAVTNSFTVGIPHFTELATKSSIFRYMDGDRKGGDQSPGKENVV